MRTYSPFLCTLHDETGPVGKLGRGVHYSIVRAVVWRDSHMRLLPRTAFADVAIIWDEDHDTRIVPFVEDLYFEGLLSNVLFVGERKGMVTILSENHTKGLMDLHGHRAHVENDYWDIQVLKYDMRGHNNITSDGLARENHYLENIKMLWALGIKDSRDLVLDLTSL